MQSMWVRQQSKGFTIVELLIVIVIIAILASITVVSYNGLQNRANDTAVKSDLKNIAAQLELYRVDNAVYPVGVAQLATMKLKVAKGSYGSHMAGVHNLLYCRVTADGPDKFALIASSKSGSVFTYTSDTGALTSASAWFSTSSVTLCQNAGVNQTLGSDRDFFYFSSAWQSYIGS